MFKSIINGLKLLFESTEAKKERRFKRDVDHIVKVFTDEGGTVRTSTNDSGMFIIYVNIRSSGWVEISNVESEIHICFMTKSKCEMYIHDSCNLSISNNGKVTDNIKVNLGGYGSNIDVSNCNVTTEKHNLGTARNSNVEILHLGSIDMLEECNVYITPMENNTLLDIRYLTNCNVKLRNTEHYLHLHSWSIAATKINLRSIGDISTLHLINSEVVADEIVVGETFSCNNVDCNKLVDINCNTRVYETNCIDSNVYVNAREHITVKRKEYHPITD